MPLGQRMAFLADRLHDSPYLIYGIFSGDLLITSAENMKEDHFSSILRGFNLAETFCVPQGNIRSEQKNITDMKKQNIETGVSRLNGDQILNLCVR